MSNNQGCGTGKAGHYAARADLSMHIFVLKWRPTMNLATECAENPQEEYLTLH